MKVLFDHQTFTLQEFGGISRYFYEINKCFKNWSEVEAKCSLLVSNNEYLAARDVIAPYSFFPGKKFKGKFWLMLALNKFNSTMAYKRGNFDVFHPTYYDPYYLSYPRKKPIVVTCLDLIQEKFIQFDVGTLANKKVSLTSADIVIAISHHTKADLIEHYDIPAERIFVTHLASSFDPKGIRKDQGRNERFLLYVGMRNLYKNFKPFITAIAPLIRDKKDLFLYCAGGGAFNDDELKFFEEMRVTDKVKMHPASDESLRSLYSQAVAFFFPTLYEGFGIPVLEAMSCGCPVAASNSSSLPEVGGDAAMYFDPKDMDSIFATAEQLVNSDTLRESMRAKGYERAKLFSWEKTARETLEVYRSIK